MPAAPWASAILPVDWSQRAGLGFKAAGENLLAGPDFAIAGEDGR